MDTVCRTLWCSNAIAWITAWWQVSTGTQSQVTVTLDEQTDGHTSDPEQKSEAVLYTLMLGAASEPIECRPSLLRVMQFWQPSWEPLIEDAFQATTLRSLTTHLV